MAEQPQKKKAYKQRCAEDFERQARKLNLERWHIHDCSMCHYKCAFVFDLKKNQVQYDAGCFCISTTLQDRSWDAVAKFYEMQSTPKVIDLFNEFWHFDEMDVELAKQQIKEGDDEATRSQKSMAKFARIRKEHQKLTATRQEYFELSRTVENCKRRMDELKLQFPQLGQSQPWTSCDRCKFTIEPKDQAKSERCDECTKLFCFYCIHSNWHIRSSEDVRLYPDKMIGQASQCRHNSDRGVIQDRCLKIVCYDCSQSINEKAGQKRVSKWDFVWHCWCKQHVIPVKSGLL
jgi:hypothetical protein